MFTIEHGLNADDGTIGQGGRMWGRQSFVGLSSKTLGTLTLGRQYDFLYAGSPMPLDMGAFLIGGLAGASAGAGTSVDNHLGGVRYENTVKWQHSFGPAPPVRCTAWAPRTTRQDGLGDARYRARAVGGRRLPA